MNGKHVWTICGDYLIDTTLMIVIKIEDAKELGYVSEKKINPESAKILSEYDTFSNEFSHYNKDKEKFIKSLTSIQHSCNN